MQKYLIHKYVIYLIQIHINTLNTEISVLSPNAGKYGPEKLQIRTLFTQCVYLTHFVAMFHFCIPENNKTRGFLTFTLCRNRALVWNWLKTTRLQHKLKCLIRADHKYFCLRESCIFFNLFIQIYVNEQVWNECLVQTKIPWIIIIFFDFSSLELIDRNFQSLETGGIWSFIWPIEIFCPERKGKLSWKYRIF